MDLLKYIPNVIEYQADMMVAFRETFIMVAVSFIISGIIGLPLGVALVATREPELYPSKVVNAILSGVIDLFRSTPTLILITAIGPFTKLIVGTQIGLKGSIVPLVVASIPLLARQIEAVLLKVDKGVIEGARSMGISPLGIIVRVILPESLSGIINAYTLTFVSLINFSAIAGAVGGGGLGAFALLYGYAQFKTDIMFVTVIILLLFVAISQTFGRTLARKVLH